LSLLISELQALQSHLGAESSDGDGKLEATLAKARATRQLIPAHHKGLLAPLYEMVVQIEDRPGAIADITQTLASHDINIRNIEVVRLREGVGGSLKLGVDSPEALSNSLNALRSRGFTAREVC
jgi:prephenate dehydrogenase